MEDSATPYRPRCIHLTCKSMMVFGEDFEEDPDFQADMADFECLKTANNMGPDNGEASLEHCCNKDRPCYEEY